MTEISCVIFDLGRVLVGWDLSEGLWPKFRAIFGPSGNRTQLGLSWEQLYDRFARGQISPKDFHRELCLLADMKLSYQDFVNQWCDIFHPLDGMELLCKQVATRVPVGLLSDTDPLHWAYVLREYPWLKLIKKPTLSFETGQLKPSPQAYLCAAQNMGVRPEACFFTDDLPKNVQGARSVGMHAERFTGTTQLRQHLVDRKILTA